MEEDAVAAQGTWNFKREWWKALLFSLAIPVCVLGFFLFAPHWLNAKIRQQITQNINEARNLQPAEKARQIALFAKLDFSQICLEKPRQYAALEEMFERSGTVGNFQRLRGGLYGSSALMILLATALGGILALNFRARRNPANLIPAFRLGWKLCMATALLELLLLVPLLGYALFEFSVLLMERFFVQLLVVLISAGACALWVSIKILLQNVPLEFEEPLACEVPPAEAPRLWKAVRDAAQRLQTAPPDHIIVGMQLNFYVTEMTVKLVDGETRGRTLFLSHPLIQYLSEAETLSVIGHELGHFIGNDTRVGTEFHPMKFKANATMATLERAGWMGWTSLQLLRFFTICFAETEQSTSRQREFLADRHSAALTSAETVAKALIRVDVFSAAFGHAMEDALRNHGCSPMEAPLRAVVANRLIPDAAFWNQLFQTRQAHPLDSHPSLQARLDALAQHVSVEQAQSMALLDEPSAFSQWLAEETGLFAGINQEAHAALQKMRHQADVVQADASTETGKSLLEVHFPEVCWKAKYPLEAAIFLGLGGLALAGAVVALMVVADWNLFTAIAAPMGVVLYTRGHVLWKYHRNATLKLDSQGLRYTCWDRPVAFSDVQSISAVRTANGVLLVLHLKAKQPPRWPLSVPFRRKSVTFLLSRVEGDAAAILQTVARYLTREIPPQ